VKRLAFATAIAAVLAGCSQPLPEPESPAAKLYAQRCNECHRVFGPGTLTAAMWEFQVERMQGEMVRRGFPPLNSDEKNLVLDYLRRHSAGSQEKQP
jgi:hypothetical protein